MMNKLLGLNTKTKPILYDFHIHYAIWSNNQIERIVSDTIGVKSPYPQISSFDLDNYLIKTREELLTKPNMGSSFVQINSLIPVIR